MSERKVLNKYYPPDFDPTKIPKLKGPRNKTFNIRIMAPFNMRCNTCGEYVYKGKKFNSRKETVETENYLGLHIHRFYIKCPRCVAEIAFKTDPENTDYTLEAGATRNFEAAKTAMALAVKAQKEKEEEELNNPMKTLENRTKASRNEMERIENLEELREMNARYAKVDHESMLKLSAAYEAQLERLQDEEDEAVVSRAFGNERCKRLADDSDDESGGGPSLAKVAHVEKPTDLLLEAQPSEPSVSVTAAPSSSAAIETPPPAAPSMPAAPTSTKSRADPLRNLVVKPKAQSALKGLVVRKKPTSTEPAKNDDPKTENSKDSERRRGEIVSSKNTVDKTPTTVVSVKTSGEPKGALSLLGNYSETDESD